MKTIRFSRSIGFAATLLALAALRGESQEFSLADARNNTAVARSPRAQEAFPALARHAPMRPVRTAAASSHTALNASPRMIEEQVELARPRLAEDTAAGGQRPVWGVPLAANPRALEENPELARRVLPAAAEPAFQVAPIK